MHPVDVGSSPINYYTKSEPSAAFLQTSLLRLDECEAMATRGLAHRSIRVRFHDCPIRREIRNAGIHTSHSDSQIDVLPRKGIGQSPVGLPELEIEVWTRQSNAWSVWISFATSEAKLGIPGNRLLEIGYLEDDLEYPREGRSSLPQRGNFDTVLVSVETVE